MSAEAMARGVILPALVFAAALAVLLGLGFWQLDRRAWKDELIAAIRDRLTAPSLGLPGYDTWSTLQASEMEYRRVAFAAEFLNDREALVYTPGSPMRPDVGGPGFWVMTPARVPGGGIVFVNRGFVPQGREKPGTRAEGQIASANVVGVLRWPEPQGLFTPKDDPVRGIFFAREPMELAKSRGIASVAPFYVEQEAPPAPGGLPRVGRIEPRLTNNHLQYALTWFGLAGALAAVFAVWLRQRLAPRG